MIPQTAFGKKIMNPYLVILGIRIFFSIIESFLNENIYERSLCVYLFLETLFLYLMAHEEKIVWFFRNTDTCSCGYGLFRQFSFFNFRMCIRLKQVYIFDHFFIRNHFLGLIKRKETAKASGIGIRI